jgi:hypothetical protein
VQSRSSIRHLRARLRGRSPPPQPLGRRQRDAPCHHPNPAVPTTWGLASCDAVTCQAGRARAAAHRRHSARPGQARSAAGTIGFGSRGVADHLRPEPRQVTTAIACLPWIMSPLAGHAATTSTLICGCSLLVPDDSDCRPVTGGPGPPVRGCGRADRRLQGPAQTCRTGPVHSKSPCGRSGADPSDRSLRSQPLTPGAAILAW